MSTHTIPADIAEEIAESRRLDAIDEARQDEALSLAAEREEAES